MKVKIVWCHKNWNILYGFLPLINNLLTSINLLCFLSIMLTSDCTHFPFIQCDGNVYFLAWSSQPTPRVPNRCTPPPYRFNMKPHGFLVMNSRKFTLCFKKKTSLPRNKHSGSALSSGIERIVGDIYFLFPFLYFN